MLQYLRGVPADSEENRAEGPDRFTLAETEGGEGVGFPREFQACAGKAGLEADPGMRVSERRRQSPSGCICSQTFRSERDCIFADSCCGVGETQRDVIRCQAVPAVQDPEGSQPCLRVQ
jgi:hypothetical protein